MLSFEKPLFMTMVLGWRRGGDVSILDQNAAGSSSARTSCEDIVGAPPVSGSDALFSLTPSPPFTH